MKKLLITLMLISPFSFAGWGDVYYCQMTSLSATNLEGVRTGYKLEKFQFKLDETKNAMVFGKDGYFNGYVMKLGMKDRDQDVWYADEWATIAAYQEGKFLYSKVSVASYMVSDGEVMSMSANCDKF